MFCRIMASFSFSPCLLQGQAEHGLAVDGDLGAVAIEEIEHLGVLHAGIDQDHVDEGVQLVGMVLPADLSFLPSAFLSICTCSSW